MSGKTMEDSIKSEFSGNVAKAYLAISKKKHFEAKIKTSRNN